MGKKEQEKVLLTGPIQDLDGTILGKQKDDPDDDDKYAEYDDAETRLRADGAQL